MSVAITSLEILVNRDKVVLIEITMVFVIIDENM